MRNYLYISKTKVDTYYSQYKKKQADRTVIKGRFKLPCWLFELKKEWGKITDLQKLSIVESKIRNSYDIGNIDYPGIWVGDELDVFQVSLKAAQDAMLLIGKKKNTYVLIIGSSKHIIGNSVPSNVDAGLPMSYAYGFTNALTDAIQKCDEKSPEWLKLNEEWGGVPFFSLDEHNLSTIMINMYKYSNTIPLRVRILSVRLWHHFRKDPGEPNGRYFLLTSPLFVELL